MLHYLKSWTVSSSGEIIELAFNEAGELTTTRNQSWLNPRLVEGSFSY